MPKQHLHSQLVVVSTPNWEAVEGRLQRYELDVNEKNWLEVGESIPVVVGKHGTAFGMDFQNNNHWPVKQEGDARTPAGIFKLGPIFGFASATEAKDQYKLSYFPLSETSVCVDDVKSHYYNQLLDSSTIQNPDWDSAEQMRAVPLYDVGSVIQYNPQGEAGKGSCIFLHIWRNPTNGTAGCIAMDAEQLKQLLMWLDSAKDPVIVVLPNDPDLRKLVAKQFPSFPDPF